MEKPAVNPRTEARKRELWGRMDQIFQMAHQAGRAMTDAENDEYERLSDEIGQLDDHSRHEQRGREAGLTTVRRDDRLLPGGERLGRQAGAVSERDVVLRREQRFADWLRVNGRGAAEGEAELRLGASLRGLLTGRWDGSEAEQRALSGVGSSGSYLLPETLSAQVIDRLRAQSVVQQAGAITVPMPTAEVHLARLATGATASWRRETAAIASSDPTFQQVNLSARMVYAFVKLSRELLSDAPNIETVLTNELTRALALEIDRVALRGLGAAGEPSGVDAYSAAQGIQEESMGTDGAQLADYDKLVDVVIDIMSANAPAPTAAIMHPRTLGGYAKLKTGLSGDKSPLAKPSIIDELRFLPTTAVSTVEVQGASSASASRVYVGDWSELLIGVRSEVEIEPIRERWIETMEVGFVASARIDIALAHPQSFGRLIGILP